MISFFYPSNLSLSSPWIFFVYKNFLATSLVKLRLIKKYKIKDIFPFFSQATRGKPALKRPNVPPSMTRNLDGKVEKPPNSQPIFSFSFVFSPLCAVSIVILITVQKENTFRLFNFRLMPPNLTCQTKSIIWFVCLQM